MPVLKAPPKLIRNATIQVRVEEEIDYKLRKYAEFIDSTPAFVVAESLKLVFNKDAEFREWLANQADQPAVSQTENPTSPEPAHAKPSTRAMFEDAPQRAVNG
jgi:predicted transcriptional regulator